MKILVVSDDELFGSALAIELCDAGHSASFSTTLDGGYDMFVIDADSVDVSRVKSRAVTFSTKEGKATLLRPFLNSDLVCEVEKAVSADSNYVNRDRYEHLRFTDKERLLLDLLLDNRGNAVSTEEIIKKVWGKGESSSNIVNVYIRYLREKLEGSGDKRIIFTVRGKGYKIE